MTQPRHAVLAALHDGPVSERTLAAKLGVPQADVQDYLDELRAIGYGIQRDETGYQITSLPAFGACIEAARPAGYQVEFHDQIASTNHRARELVTEGQVDVAVIADEQTGGRGRLDRSWTSPPGGIYLSLGLRPNLTPPQVPLLTLGAAVATATAIREAGASVGIKWPNDILTTPDELKLAGILTESATTAETSVAWTVIGIGINANTDPESLPDGATSLRALIGDVDRCHLTTHLLETFESLYEDPDTICDRWRSLTTTLGRAVRIDTGDSSIEGTATDITDTGALCVETAAGLQEITAGDCDHLRPL